MTFVKVIAPTITIKELPSESFIRRCRTILLIVCQMLAAYRVAKSPKIGTIHTDGTGRRQTAIMNLVATILENGSEDYFPVLLSASIIPEDETADCQHDAIIDFFEEKRGWLQKWADNCDVTVTTHILNMTFNQMDWL